MGLGTACLALILTSILYTGTAAPIPRNDAGAETFMQQSLVFLFGTTIAVAICSISLLIICACWGTKKRIKLQSISSQIELQNQSGDPSIFASTLSSHLSISDSKIYFEPLPDITPRAHVKKVSLCLAQSENWFAEPYQNFPRSQLQYIRKIGSGWFGHVLEGRAVGIDTDHTSTAISRLQSEKIDCNTVVVKCLREDATVDEQSYFLQELLPFKKLQHINLLRLLSFCLEAQPFLILMEYCSKGDLKSVLKREAFSAISLLQMAAGVAEGLCHMHQHGFLHTDLAARNCLVTGDNVAKIGDYGNSIEAFKNEYYLAERIALPLRWCAPESLKCTETTIETVELTKEANVWSFGVLLWEVLSLARLPYSDLGNDEIIQKVILEKSVRLETPSETLHRDEVNAIFEACFAPVDSREDMEHVISIFHRIFNLESSKEDEFDKRWNQMRSSPMKSPAEEPLSNCSSVGDSSSKEGWQPFTGESNIVDSGSKRQVLGVVTATVPVEEHYDSLTPIAAAIKTLDDSLAAKCSDSLSNGAGHIADSIHEADKWSKMLTESEEDFLTKRLEQGEFSELVRMKSQSVQDLMCMTVIDYSSDSSDRASQLGSLPGDPSSLVSEKNFCSEGNLREAARDDCFMVELERLQEEHRFSIVSEVSREDESFENGNLTAALNDQISPISQTPEGDPCSVDTPPQIFDLSSLNSSTVPLESSHTTNITTDATSFDHFTTISTLHKEKLYCNSDHLSEREHNGVFGSFPSGQEAYPSLDKDPITRPDDLDGGKFWKSQMAAWQEAAQETRELLQEAANSSTNKSDNVTDSPQKHSETSEEDSETYISYGTPKEEEDLYDVEDGEINLAFSDGDPEYSEINPADLMALRSELSLKLSSSTDACSDLEPQEEIYINYRTGPVSLSPIKEESFLGEYESPEDTDTSVDEEDSLEIPKRDNSNGWKCSASNSDEKLEDSGQVTGDSSTNSQAQSDESAGLVGSTDNNCASIVDSGIQNVGIRPHDGPSKYLYNVCQPLEPDSGYSNMLGHDASLEPHYQPYFNTGVTNVIQCGASLEDGSIYDSTEHTSLPYEVNFPDQFLDLGADGGTTQPDGWSLNFTSDNNGHFSDALRSIDNNESPSSDHISCVDASEVMLTQKSLDDVYQNGTKEADDANVQSLPADDYQPPSGMVDDDGGRESADGESDVDSSSTSGEFVWAGNETPGKETSCGRVHGLEGDSSKVSSDCSETDSDSGEEEFTPSMWNSQLTPKQSLLKSPEMNSTVKKSVHWKQQKHHRVYEYPPEPVTWHAEEAQQRRTWGGHNLDYLTLADWEFAEEFSVEDHDQFEQFSCTNHTNTVPPFYSIAPLSYQSDESMVADDCDFLFRSGQPFAFKQSAFAANEYFPRDQPPPADAKTEDNAHQAGSATGGTSMGEMRYSKDNLRLNLPPLLGTDCNNEILDNQRSEDEVLNNDDCSNFSQ